MRILINKPLKYNHIEYPFNELHEEKYEELLYKAFSKHGHKYLQFDSCVHVAGSGDKGCDLILVENAQTVGVVQCKRYKSPLSKPNVVKEIIKFVVYALQEPATLRMDRLTYFFAVSTGYSKDALTLLVHFSKMIEREKQLKQWVHSVCQNYKTITFDYMARHEEIVNLLKALTVHPLSPNDLGDLIRGDSELVSQYFEVEKVLKIDAPSLDLDRFLVQYEKGVLNHLSRINFFGLALQHHRKPREVSLEEIFVRPSLTKRKNRTHHYTQSKWDLAGKSRFIQTFTENTNKSNCLFDEVVMDGKRKISTNTFTSKTSYIADYITLSGNIFNVFTEKHNDKQISFENLFSNMKHLVILGKPGAGKSSLIKYAIMKLLAKEQLFNEKSVYGRVPLRIELHHYNKTKQADKKSLLDYIQHQLEHTYQLAYMSKDATKQLLMEYDTLLFFDGMDEVLDVYERFEVRNDIENFIEAFNRVRVVVTSRYESYNDVSFDKVSFEVYEVNDFDDTQIVDYVNRWYRIEQGNDKGTPDEIESCLQELSSIEDELKRNPLLLTLILILYRNQMELPTSKLELYEGCTTTLIETRDNKEKKLGIKLNISNKMATFSALAHWQYNKLTSDSSKGITHKDAHLQIKKYLLEKGEFEYDDEAERATEDFLEFAKNRSIYVENNFTHKTFLEYFTAYYLYTTCFSNGENEKGQKIISAHIGDASWSVILELLLCKIDHAQGTFKVLDSIVQRQLKHQKTSDDALAFFLYMLKYLQNISPKMKMQLIEKGISFCINFVQIERNRAVLINNYLLQLNKIEQIKKWIIQKVNDCEFSTRCDAKLGHNYLIFVLENTIVDSDCYKRIMSNEGAQSKLNNDPYLFILRALQQPFDYDRFKSELQLFIMIHSKTALKQGYRSLYRDNIFYGSDTFNWIRTFLFAKQDVKHFITVMKIFRSSGVSNAMVKAAIDCDEGSSQISLEHMLALYNRVGDKQLKSVIEKMLLKYYSHKVINKDERPFYHNINGGKRNFSPTK